MTAVLSPLPKQAFLDNNGRPLVGGLLFVYEAGTTTKATTYTSSTGLAPNANPIVLDYRGDANVWLTPNVGYKFVLAPANDTDPPGAPIWTVDNITEAQLITLYGGVDTGTTNSYVLNFNANFTAYTDGIVIYWIPSNTNTGPSTLNVNGLGPVTIRDQSGAVLLGGAIIAGAVTVVMYKGGQWLLVSNGALGNAGPVLTGSFVPAWTGFGTPPINPVTWFRYGPLVGIRFAPAQATSNATTMTFTNLPAVIQPTVPFLAAPFGYMPVLDVGNPTPGCFGCTGIGVIEFGVGDTFGGFTASGTKGLVPGSTILYTVPQ